MEGRALVVLYHNYCSKGGFVLLLSAYDSISRGGGGYDKKCFWCKHCKALNSPNKHVLDRPDRQRAHFVLLSVYCLNYKSMQCSPDCISVQCYTVQT